MLDELSRRVAPNRRGDHLPRRLDAVLTPPAHAEESSDDARTPSDGPEPDEPRIRLCLLEGFDLVCDDDHIRIDPSAQRLIAFLAIHERSLPRAYVAGRLWPEASERRAAGNLRSALWRLRAQRCDVVEAVDQRLGIGLTVNVDVRRAAAVARALCADDQTLPTAVLDELVLTGELLPGWYDDWLIIERERQRQIRLHALEALCERQAGLGRFAQAILAGLAAVRDDPLRESAHRALIRAHLAEGNPGEALRQYRICAEVLDRELHLQPSGAIAALVAGFSAE